MDNRTRCLQKIICMGGGDVWDAFHSEDMVEELSRYRAIHGLYGNINFIFSLSDEQACKLYETLGVTLGGENEKDDKRQG